MSASPRSSEGLDTVRRRILFRSRHRGMREMDLIMGQFADAEIENLNAGELAEFETLLDEQDQKVLSWICGTEPTPPEYDTPLFRRICAFHVAARGVIGS